MLSSVLVVFFLSVVASSTSGARTGIAGASGYGWPVKPFDRQHSIRGVVGDPRTIFVGPPTAETLLSGKGEFAFHMGIDIAAADGSQVFPVRDGRVSEVSTVRGRERVTVASRDSVFQYWHIVPRVRVGQAVTARETVLGTICPRVGHMDLTEVDGGHATNPLAPGHLTPYSDRTRPRVAAIFFRSDGGGAATFPNFVRGRVLLVAEAYDEPAMPVPGVWKDLPVVPARVTWRIQGWAGKIVVPTEVAADFRTTLPDNNAFWRIYARGTFQNMAVFGAHYSFLEPGRYLFRLGTRPLATRMLPDGVYDAVVTASDIRGNTSSLSRRFTIHNRSGWVGS